MIPSLIKFRYISYTFPIKVVQMDGESEFMGEFERECEQRKTKLFVLPPRFPMLNGCEERANRTHTEEFYEVYDIPEHLVVAQREVAQMGGNI